MAFEFYGTEFPPSAHLTWKKAILPSKGSQKEVKTDHEYMEGEALKGTDAN